jgi:ketosteroid isomerase-like protein
MKWARGVKALKSIAFLVIPLGLLGGAAPISKDGDQIRERRLAYSAAIEARRPDHMRGFLADDMVQLSSNGETAIGRDAVLQTYAAHEFRDPNFIVYERLPDSVDISDNGRSAVERGHWRGRFRQADGTIAGNSGLYQAGWIKRGGAWLIRTESYVRLHCLTESDCPK